MTREEAKVILEDNKPSIIFEDEELQKRSADVCAALDMAISALEQEPLENIRAEIASHIGGCGFLNDGLDLALEIIDKHIEGR